MDKLTSEKTKGFSTVELMIALAIMSLVLSAVVLVTFGNQSFLLGSQTNTEALKKAQGLIEEEQALSRKDFNLVNSTQDSEADTSFCPSSIDGQTVRLKRYDPADIYCYRVDVEAQAPDYASKEVTVSMTWKDERGFWKNNQQMVKISTLITNFEGVIGGSTCSSTPSGDWKNPKITNSETDFATLIGDSDPTNVYTVSDVDAYLDKLYVTAFTNKPTNPTFFVFDTEDGELQYEDEYNIDTTGNSVSSGANSVVVVKNNLGHYAYVANNYSPDFGGCTEGINCAQLQVVDVSDPSNLNIIKNYKLPYVDSSTGGAGNSIFYKNGYIYLGLTSTGNDESELNIIDVHTPSNPINLGPGIDLGNHDVNAILVKGMYAYVASADTGEQLRVVDISDPGDPEQVSEFSGAGGRGKSIWGVGDSVYLGTATGNGSRLHLLDASNPGDISAAGIEKSFTASVDGVIVRDNLAFVLTKTVLEIVDSLTLDPVSSLSLTNSGSGVLVEPAFDCEGNYLYITFNNSGGEGKIYVVTAD